MVLPEVEKCELDGKQDAQREHRTPLATLHLQRLSCDRCPDEDNDQAEAEADPPEAQWRR